MEKNGLGARNPSVRLVRHKKWAFSSIKVNRHLLCPGVGMSAISGAEGQGLEGSREQLQ